MMLCLVFLYGLLFGSFYNVIGWRVPVHKSVVKPRSACPHCGHKLGALELIPLFSYLFQKGKCRCCQAPISPLYPIIELMTGLLFMWAYHLYGFTWEFLMALTFLSLMVIITVSDLVYMLIPDKILLFFLPIFIVERSFYPLFPWWDSLVGSLFGFLLLLFLTFVTQGGMGGGDIKLFGLIGIMLGTEKMLLVLFLASLFGAVASSIFLLFRKIQKGKPIPFGPYIAAASVLVYFYGGAILDWYFGMFR